MSQTQQLGLLGSPRIIPVCHYCHQPKSKTLSLRAALAARYPEYKNEPGNGVCCDPGSESRCPRCNSSSLEFGEFVPNREVQTGYDGSCEAAYCLDCGWIGDPDDAAPAVQPWAELEAVREQADQLVELMPVVEFPVRFLEVA